jgi:hypothetical protein
MVTVIALLTIAVSAVAGPLFGDVSAQRRIGKALLLRR